MKFTTRQRLMASTLLFGAATLATPALAQSTDESAETPVSAEADPDAGAADPGSSDAEEAKEIVITGSRIQRPDLTSTSPLAVVQDEEFALSGSVNVESVLNTLPQVVPGTTAFSNNPGGGVATLNLRGLGSARNLVLVNGRRYIFYSTNQVTDLNTIPAFLLDSVDVVTGGASAVYGSDAIAGVTNFHLRNDLNGMLAGGQYSITEDGDGARYNAYVALGTDFGDGRGNVTVYGEYYNRKEIFADARGFSAFSLNDVGNPSTGLVPGGSAGVPQGRISLPVGSAGTGTNYTGPAGSNASLGAFFSTPGVSVPYCGDPCSYNYAPSNYIMVPQERWTIGGYGEYEIIEGVNAYGEVTFVNNQVDNELAATPISQKFYIPLATVCTLVSAADCAQLTTIAANQQAAIAADPTLLNQFASYGAFNAGAGAFNALQPNEVALVADYRFTQIANRRSLDDRNAYRLVGGFRGGITSDINYDVYYSYARTRNSQIQEGNVSRSAFVRNVENGTCNIFGLDQLSQTCITNVSLLAANSVISSLQVAQGSISGRTPLTLPWANEAIGFAIGTEWRTMAARFIPDTALASGDVAGFNAGRPTEGSYDVKELFGELRVPIVQDSWIHRLELSGAARYSDYSLEAVGGVWTYAAGAEFAPVRDITFRAQYQRAVRAPNVGELFGGQSPGFPQASDPCAAASAATDPAIRAVCIATGVPAAAVGTGLSLQPNSQIEGLFGGNPNLQEEVADTYTVGAIIRPSFIPRLNIAVDYYDIRVLNSISAGAGGVQQTLNLCYLTLQDPSSTLCQAINRDANGRLSGQGIFVVEALNANLARFDSEGIDFQVDYSHPFEFGLFGPNSRMSFFFLGTYTKESSFTPVVGVNSVVECAGRFGANCGDPTPRWKWSSRVTWMDGPLTTSLRWRHVGRTRDDGTRIFFVEELDPYNLFDLAFSFNATDNATFNFGINNLFDKKPPIMGSNAQQTNTYPSTFDVLGRDFFVSANFRL